MIFFGKNNIPAGIEEHVWNFSYSSARGKALDASVALLAFERLIIKLALEAMPIRAPFGSWKSPITTGLLTQGKIALSSLKASATGAIFWQEGRPMEKGS